MPETPRPRLADYALEVRSKNAGPFWVTLEAFMRDEVGYRIASDAVFLNEEVVGPALRHSGSRHPDLPDPLAQRRQDLLPAAGVPGEPARPRRPRRQHHVPLAMLEVPDRLLAESARP
ncbi:DUF4387 domain-containing protein [Actinomadura madurae]|nr:DUF4387 family protein [Actinomadura madurae]MCQ0013630.1 DUF4387 domain-containing protein [Actinomadura madurae]